MPKTRKLLCDTNAIYIQSLMRLTEKQSKSTLANWAIEYSEKVILPLWEKYYEDDVRPKNAINAAREWLLGKILKKAPLKNAGAWKQLLRLKFKLQRH